MKPKVFKTVPIKAQTEFASREEYHAGSCLRCANCEDGRPVEKFPDDETQPDGVSPFCDRCDTRVRGKIATHKFEAGEEAPAESRAQASARIRRAAAMEAKAMKDAPAPEDPPVEEPRDDQDQGDQGDQGEAQRHDGEPMPVNNGEMTAGAKLVIETEGLDLASIPGRKDDLKVGVPEVNAWKEAKDLAEGSSDEQDDE